ncbi:Uncharacterized protein Fot_05247 [Forsythia ovata]|uniref:Uncharacterized protein n=1 Tax=Forsythia ovata TaxID=205694 RepID=A0ABD1WSF8_9LAMI
MRAGVIQECKCRCFFENKQDEKKRKSREAAKRNRHSTQNPCSWNHGCHELPATHKEFISTMLRVGSKEQRLNFIQPTVYSNASGVSYNKQLTTGDKSTIEELDAIKSINSVALYKDCLYNTSLVLEGSKIKIDRAGIEARGVPLCWKGDGLWTLPWMLDSPLITEIALKSLKVQQS